MYVLSKNASEEYKTLDGRPAPMQFQTARGPRTLSRPDGVGGFECIVMNGLSINTFVEFPNDVEYDINQIEMCVGHRVRVITVSLQ